MSVPKFSRGSALAALAVAIAAAVPGTASARPDDEQRSAMQIRGERVREANARREEQRAQQTEQHRDQRTQQIARQRDQRVAQADRQPDRPVSRNPWQGGQRGDQTVRQTDQTARQAQQREWQTREGDRNRAYADQDRNRSYTSRNADARGEGTWRDGRRDDEHNGRWQGDRRDNDRNVTWRNEGRDHDRSWDRRWRDNSRYDWQRYRSANRTRFHVGAYYAPYRYYSYRRYGVGATIGSPFYGSAYWITNPWQYRLPDVWGPYRWVRYYDDVLLVDIYSGRVVDVVHNFFW